MAIAFRGLRTVIYPSPDLEAATSWWTAVLGIEPYFNEPFYVGFNVNGYELGLLPTGDPANLGLVPEEGQSDGALTYWGVDDVVAAVEESVAIGATVHIPPVDIGEGVMTASVRTPQGTILGFIHNEHFDTV